MGARAQVLIADDGGRRKRPGGPLPPTNIRDWVPILLIGGLVLSLSGWVDVALFYWPLRFGDAEWEFGVISGTFDALPQPTLGLILLALAARAMPERRRFSRLLAVVSAIVTIKLVGLLIIFALDIPVAFAAISTATQRAVASGAPVNPLVGSGLNRGIAKVLLFGAAYVAAFLGLTIVLGRTGARPAPDG